MSESSDKIDDTKKKDKRGILRLDINKPRNSAGSVEFREKPELFCEVTLLFCFDLWPASRNKMKNQLIS